MELQKPLNKYIEHTLLRPDATLREFQTLLDEAIRFDFAAVCVPPHMSRPVIDALGDYPDIKVCTVVGFPHGNTVPPLKLEAAHYLVEHGVDELDFVTNIGLLKSGMCDNVGDEAEAIGLVCKNGGVVSKCIVETCYLSEDEKTFMFRALNERTQVDYIKTSTGFGPKGAQLEDVANWKALQVAHTETTEGSLIKLLPIEGEKEPEPRENPLKIKAAGGIRGLAAALSFIEAGADRLGLSTSVEVMEEWNARKQTFIEGEEKT
jgi:deoxyribose-phosphate aldolase